MRDINFRAWDKKKKRYDYFTLDNIKTYEDLFQKHLLSGVEFEMSTGLKDKNGVKIFEGDIVKCETTIYTCKWNNHRCEFAWYSDNSYIYPLGDMRTFLKVIGNIHETKEQPKP